MPEKLRPARGCGLLKASMLKVKGLNESSGRNGPFLQKTSVS